MADFPVIYRRNLPHIQPYGAILFLTFRLAGSLPKLVLEKLSQERQAEEGLAHTKQDANRHMHLRSLIRKRIYLKFDQALDRGDYGPTWLSNHEIAKLVQEAIFHRHPHEYDLICFSIMPNHVHQVVININRDIPIYHTIGNLKSFTGTAANEILNRAGIPFGKQKASTNCSLGKITRDHPICFEHPSRPGSQNIGKNGRIRG